MLTKAIREVFRTNLGVKQTEKVLIFTDRPTPSDSLHESELKRWKSLRDLAMLMVETARAFAKEVRYYCYPSRGAHGKEPPEAVWRLAFGDTAVQKLKDRGILRGLVMKRASEENILLAERIIKRHCRAAVDVVVALSNYSTSHTRFRDMLTTLCGARYASMPLFDIGMFEGAMDVDWKKLQQRSRSIAGIIRQAVSMRIMTPSGTDLMVYRGRRRVNIDDGNLRRKGSFGNLPAGEVFFAPVEGTASGKIVLEWAPTRRLKTPVTLIVRDGQVRDVLGDEPFVNDLVEKLKQRPENGNIAEIGFGTNDRASRPDNILESEKIFGTVHIALGDNSSFGGRVKTPFHQDFIQFRPTVIIQHRNGSTEEIITDGRWTVLE